MKNGMRISLAAARINKGMTQEQVATALNVSKKTVWSWENGITRPKIDKVEAICDLYGVTYDDISWGA